MCSFDLQGSCFFPVATKFRRGVDFDVEMNRAIHFIMDFENTLEGRFPNSDSRYLRSFKKISSFVTPVERCNGTTLILKIFYSRETSSVLCPPKQ